MELAEKLFSTRRGTLLLGACAAGLAAILLVVYLNRYRASLKGSTAPVAVLVAKSLIQKGAPGNIIGAERQFQVANIAKSEVRSGAITDPASLRGLEANQDIYPGQQLTTAEFSSVVPGSIQTNLIKLDRAVSIPIDTSHGLLGVLAAGDHVDVYVGFNQSGVAGTQPILKQLMQNVLVLGTPGAGASSGTVTLRAKGAQAAALAFAADNGKIWLVLRPASGARSFKPGVVTLQRLLLGIKPVR